MNPIRDPAIVGQTRARPEQSENPPSSERAYKNLACGIIDAGRRAFTGRESSSSVTVKEAHTRKYPSAQLDYRDRVEQRAYYQALGRDGYMNRLRQRFRDQHLDPRALASAGSEPATATRFFSRFHPTCVYLDGVCYAKTSSLEKGAFGKFSIALNRRGDLHALKTLRTKPAPQDGATGPSSVAEVKREVKLMRKYSSPDVHLYSDPLTAKLFIKMPLAVGSLKQITASLTPPPGVAPDVAERVRKLKRLIVRSAMRQVSEQLLLMHQDRRLHLDIKGDNVFVHGETASIKLGDMGKVLTQKRFGPPELQIGTINFAAPEAVNGQRKALKGGGADTWSLGMTLLEAHISLEHTVFDPDNSWQMLATHTAMLTWRDSMINPDGSVNVHKLISGAPSVDATDNMFTALFRTLYAEDPPLCEFLLRRVFVVAEHRADAKECVRFASGLQAASSADENIVRQGLGEHVRHNRRIKAARAALQLRLEDEVAANPRIR